MGKRILVVDVAAHEGGALTILQQYYQTALNDTDNEYVFCVSLPELSGNDHVTVLRFPWVKRSWLHPTNQLFSRKNSHHSSVSIVPLVWMQLSIVRPWAYFFCSSIAFL